MSETSEYYGHDEDYPKWHKSEITRLRAERDALRSEIEELRKGYFELRQSMRNEFSRLGIPSNPAWSDADFPWAIATIGKERDALRAEVEGSTPPYKNI